MMTTIAMIAVKVTFRIAEGGIKVQLPFALTEGGGMARARERSFTLCFQNMKKLVFTDLVGNISFHFFLTFDCKLNWRQHIIKKRKQNGPKKPKNSTGL
jgi:hypothetical protein